MAKKNRNRRNKKARANLHHAPKQGLVGQTLQWNLRQVVPVFVPASVQAGRNYFVQIIAGVEGFRVEVLEDGLVQPIGTSFGGLYGDQTGQFSELARLWASYRVEGVKARFTPTSTYQLGSLSPTLTIVDVLGGSDEKDFPNTIGWYSRSRNLIIHTAFKEVDRTVNYANWLVQCVNKPFLRTDLNGAREQYEADDIIRLPGIQMGFLFTPAQNVSASESGYLLGFLDVNALYSFRGRRLDEPQIAQSKQPFAIQTQKQQLSKSLDMPSTTQVDESEDPSKEETKTEDLTISTLMNVLKRRQ